MSSTFSEFAEEGFDLKGWINARCGEAAAATGSGSDEPLERHLAEVEMRLQLTAEDIEASLHDLSVQAMRRIPFAVQEIYRLQGDVQGMQDTLGGLASGVKRDASGAMETVVHLQRLDDVKRNMDAACSTLKEATELSGLFVKVEEVFGAGDLPRVAEMLSSMRRSLSLVGDVPEFRAGRERLRALEDRLQGMIEGGLAEALSRGQDEAKVASLCALLLAVDRLSTVEALYTAARAGAASARWDEARAGPGGASGGQALAPWLPGYLSWLAGFLEGEAAWLARVLPPQALHLTGALATVVVHAFARNLKAAMATPPTPADRLEAPGGIVALASMLRELSGLASILAALLPGQEHVARRRDVLTALFSPVEERVEGYGALEAAQLGAELLAGPRVADPASSPADELASSLGAACRHAFGVMHGAVGRCVSLTGGTELRGLVRVLDTELGAILARANAAVSRLHARHAGAAGGGAHPAGALGHGDDDAEEVGGVLQLLLVHAELSSSLNRLEGSVRAAVSQAAPKLDAAAAAGAADAPPDALALRLSGHPERLARAQKLAASLQEPRFIALPGATQALEALHAGVTSTVRDALLAKVKVQLRPLPSMREWAAEGPAPSAAGVLPSFNAYPLPYVTTIGEYLMTMPQQLEVLVEAGESAAAAAAAAAADGGAAGGGSGAVGVSGVDVDVEELAAEWLDRVVSGAATLVAGAVGSIPALGQQGGAQLSADVEYFCNVMAALHSQPPASLLTVQLFAGLPAELFRQGAAQAAEDGGADAATLAALTTMRGLGGAAAAHK
ncbi:hypothetical protein FOA52_007460 [Chlamydomonas sp. UWO 241]|nr:hypothetical protein FOA52_007460 [Chlamydomonas sp. UWO 241]